VSLAYRDRSRSNREVIKLKNYDDTFDNATAPAFIAAHQISSRALSANQPS
jgi:hypothetical protein